MAADAKLLLDTLLRADSTSMQLLLESVDCSQTLQEKSVAREWIAKINTLLNSAKERWMGICLLAHLLKQCDTEVFLENCLSWHKMLTRFLQQEKQGAVLSKYIAEIFERMFSFSTQFPQLSREISSSVVPSLLTAILNEKSNLFEDVALKTVRSCIQYYPGPCGAYWKRIETFVLGVFNSKNITMMEAACSCFALLPKCGNPTGSGADKQSASWEMQWRKLVNTLSHIIGDLYTNYESENTLKEDSTVLDLKPIPVTEPQRTETCVFRIKMLFECLTLMLRNEFSKSINIPVNATVKLVQRILVINGTSMGNRLAIEAVLLKATLPSIHVSGLKFLLRFIESCRMNLLPYHGSLIKILLAELSWSASDSVTIGSQQMFSELRSIVYECIQLWVHVAGSLGERKDTVKKIVDHVINDVKPQTTTTKLLAPSLSKNTLGKKGKKRRVQDDVNQLTRPQQKVDNYANVELCVSGLKTLKIIVSKIGNDIPPQLLKEIQVFAVRLLLECQPASQLTFPIPYGSTECRKLLYHLLQSLLYYHNPASPPPVQHAIHIFSRGVQDPCLEISQFCTEAQMVCNILIHPRVAVLASPLSLIQQEQVVYTNHSKPMEVNAVNDKQNSIEVGITPLTTTQVFKASTSSQEAGEKRSISFNYADVTADAPVQSRATSSSRKTPELILQRKLSEDSNRGLLDYRSEASKDVNITSLPVNGEGTDVTIQPCSGVCVDMVQTATISSQSDPADTMMGPSGAMNNNEHHPPMKKRKTSIENTSDSIENLLDTTMEEDELTQDMIASFVDSVPDSD